MVLTIHLARSMDPVGSCLCHPQEFHFRACASDSGYHAKGCQAAEEMGLGCGKGQTESQIVFVSCQCISLHIVLLPT
jgi:hypothetical protein